MPRFDNFSLLKGFYERYDAILIHTGMAPLYKPLIIADFSFIIAEICLKIDFLLYINISSC